MPHITIKMLEGRSDSVKDLCVSKVAKALQEATGTPDCYISVSVEDYTAEEWQDVYKNEVAENPNLKKMPSYNPKDLL